MTNYPKESKMKPVDFIHHRPFLIAVTGGICSGKSTVSKWFDKNGFVVFSADEIAHFILDYPDVKEKLKDKFGDEIIRNKKVNRKKLGEIVFGNPENLKFLNGLLHPKIRAEMQKIIDFYYFESDRPEYLVFEIPLLFENGLEKAFDLTINVYTDKNKQIQRLRKRDHLSIAEAEKRISAQMSSETKMKKADINIVNNGTRKSLYSQLEKIVASLADYDYKKIVHLIHIN